MRPLQIALGFDANTQGKLITFSLARLCLLTILLFTTIFLRQEVLGEQAIGQIYLVLGVSFLLSLATVAFWDETLKVSWFISSQLLYDLLLTSYLVFLTGIDDSIFLFLYLLNIVFASTIYQLNGALLVASLSGVVYAFIYYANMDTDAMNAWYNLAYNELFFLLTALLCGQLMGELKRQKFMLVRQQENISRLQLLNDRLLNSIPLGVVVVDRDDYVQNINQTGLSLLNLGHAPDMRIKYYELFPTLRGIIQSWAQMSEKQRLRFHFHPSESSTDHFSLQVVRLSGSGEGETADQLEYILLFQDVSKVLELEQKLETESKLAATGQLAAGIAHEIRNPLASISGSIELLSSHLEISSEEDKKLLEISLREIRRLNRLITDFLEFAKPRETENRETYLRSLLDEVKDALKNRSNAPLQLELLLNVDPTLQVFCDPERVKQVFFNLFLNSVEAAVGSSMQIAVTAKPNSEGMAEIEVADNGEGIPEALHKKIFDPFFTTKTNGTGLGLTTVAQIVKASGGEIALARSVKGALFRIHLPMPDRNAIRGAV